MRIHPECVSCIVRQAALEPRRFTDEKAVKERILRRVLAELAEFDLERTPPEMGGMLSRIIAEELDEPDPYGELKRYFNEQALALLPGLRQRILAAPDRFGAVVRLAIAGRGAEVDRIAGNAIDFGAPAGHTEGDLEQLFAQVLETPLAGEGEAAVARLERAAERAEKILYLADNAGEIAFDRLLIEQLPPGKVTLVVRAGPAINDALHGDAEQVGLTEIVPVMSSGAVFPGTPLQACSPAFRQQFLAADLIISKGQGNFETLDDQQTPGAIFFLLKVKCEVVSACLGVQVGALVARGGPCSSTC